MKKSCLAVATFAMVAGTAYAQSNVTLSGVVGLGVRYTTNANTAGDSRWSLGANPDSYGIFRMVGNEDIGQGLKAHFHLEGGFRPDTGDQAATGAASGLFGRQATVGLTTPVGRFDFGRINVAGTAAEPIVVADPTNAGGNETETLWAGAYTGIRLDNAIRYRIVASGVTAGAMYSFGEQAGNNSKGSVMTGTLGYASGPFNTIAAYQVAKDANEKSLKTFSLGGIYRVMPTFSLHAAYMNGNVEATFAGAGISGARSGLANPIPTRVMPAHKMNFYLAGLTYQATPVTTLRAAYYYGKTTDGTFTTATTGGKIHTAYLVGNYALSKRTSLVAGLDYNKWSEGFAGFWGSAANQGLGINATNGKDTRTNVTVGVRHVF